jgi:hypothetical protein
MIKVWPTRQVVGSCIITSHPHTIKANNILNVIIAQKLKKKIE